MFESLLLTVFVRRPVCYARFNRHMVKKDIHKRSYKSGLVYSAPDNLENDGEGYEPDAGDYGK